MRTVSALPFNTSPKIVADLIVTVLTFLLGKYAISLDPAVAAAIAKVLGFLAAYFTEPASVIPNAEAAGLSQGLKPDAPVDGSDG